MASTSSLPGQLPVKNVTELGSSLLCRDLAWARESGERLCGTHGFPRVQASGRRGGPATGSRARPSASVLPSRSGMLAAVFPLLGMGQLPP